MPIIAVSILILILVAALLAGPIFTIWSLNLLFGFAIPVTFKTYLAAMWLAMVVSGAGVAATKSNPK